MIRARLLEPGGCQREVQLLVLATLSKPLQTFRLPFGRAAFLLLHLLDRSQFGGVMSERFSL